MAEKAEIFDVENCKDHIFDVENCFRGDSCVKKEMHEKMKTKEGPDQPTNQQFSHIL